MLNRRQLEQFRQDGFIVVDDIFSSSEVEALRRAAEDPVVRTDLRARRSDEECVHLLEITVKHIAFRKLAVDRRIVDVVAQLIGPDVQLQHSKLATKPSRKGAGAFDWHQDYAFYPHTSHALVAVMVMLDDATPENGCMHAVRGSYRLGPLDHTRDGLFSAACQEAAHWRDNQHNVVPLMPRAGGMSIHHCLTLHGSPANASGSPRRGVVFSYRASQAYQLADHVWLDTGFQVCGDQSEFVTCGDTLIRLPRYADRTNALGQPFGTAYNQVGEYAAKWNLQNDPRRRR